MAIHEQSSICRVLSFISQPSPPCPKRPLHKPPPDTHLFFHSVPQEAAKQTGNASVELQCLLLQLHFMLGPPASLNSQSGGTAAATARTEAAVVHTAKQPLQQLQEAAEHTHATLPLRDSHQLQLLAGVQWQLLGHVQRLYEGLYTQGVPGNADACGQVRCVVVCVSCLPCLQQTR